jgi:hypothetical protein
MKLKEGEQAQVSSSQQARQGQIEGQRRLPRTRPRTDKDKPRLTAIEVEEQQAI